MLFRRPSRPFDPTGRKIQNLVINEIRPLDKDEKYVFVPSHGPFFSESVVVRQGKRVLVRDKDYQVLILHKQATLDIGKEIGVCIRIIDTSLPEVSIDYQAVGGNYVDLVDVLRSIREGFGDQLLKPIRWVDIVGKPNTFNPAAHYHAVWDVSGWEGWINALDSIRQALIYVDHNKYQKAYDYAQTKFADIVNNMDNDIQRVRNKIQAVSDELIPSVGAVRLSTKNAQYTDGIWVDNNKDTLLFAVTNDGDIGREWEISAEPVAAIPDNVILDEDDAYLLQDIDEWIYRDNEHPADGTGGTNDYWEDIDEQWDALTVKLYRLQSLNPVHSHTLAVSAPTMIEGDVVLFTVNTIGYPLNTSIIYQLTGVGTSNVNVPLFGVIKTNADGVATLAVKLIEGSPRTDMDRLTFRTSLDASKSVSTRYTLASNMITDIGVRYVTNLSDLPVGSLVQGTTFKVKVIYRGVVGKTLKLCSNIPATLGYTVNGTNAPTVGDRGVVLKTPVVNENAQYVNVTLGYNNDLANSDIKFWVEVSDETFEGIDILLEKRIVNIEFVDLNGVNVDQGIKPDQYFRIKVKHNGRHTSPFTTTVSTTPISDRLSPSKPATFYTNASGVGSSDNLIVSKGVDGTLDFIIAGDSALGTIRKSLQVIGDN